MRVRLPLLGVVELKGLEERLERLKEHLSNKIDPKIDSEACTRREGSALKYLKQYE